MEMINMRKILTPFLNLQPLKTVPRFPSLLEELNYWMKLDPKELLGKGWKIQKNENIKKAY